MLICPKPFEDIHVTVMSDIQPLDTWLATFSYSFLIASGNIAFDIFGIDSDMLMALSFSK